MSEHLKPLGFEELNANILSLSPVKKKKSNKVKDESCNDEESLKLKMKIRVELPIEHVPCFAVGAVEFFQNNPTMPMMCFVRTMMNMDMDINYGVELKGCILSNFCLSYVNPDCASLTFIATATPKANEIAILAELWQEPIVLAVEPGEPPAPKEDNKDGGGAVQGG